MKKRSIIACGVYAIMACLCLCIGYASITSTLAFTGRVTAPSYDTLVATDIDIVDSNATAESHSLIMPTNVKTTISGTKGQRVTYRISVHNFSRSQTFVFNGIRYDNSFAATMNKLAVSVSMNADGTSPLSTTRQPIYVSGTPIAPGEELTFYVTYTLTADVSSEQLLINYTFEPIIYSITYMNDNELYAMDHIINNEHVYYVRTEGPEKAGRVFESWVNANAAAVTAYPAGNTNDYTLSAKWASLYLIMFVDNDGTILYEEVFNSNATSLSASGQQTVNAILAELQAQAPSDMRVTWSDYKIQGAQADIVVRPIYTYTGNLQFTPIDEEGDGIINYYQIDAVSKLDDPVVIPGTYNGIPVQVVNKLYKNESNYDFGAGIKSIEIGEGVTTVNHNALAYTSDLTLVKLPSTLQSLGKNAFSRNTLGDQKKLTIEFNGTMAQWQALISNSHEDWHNGLKDGSVVKCSDGYFELDRGFLGLGGYTWKQHKY